MSTKLLACPAVLLLAGCGTAGQESASRTTADRPTPSPHAASAVDHVVAAGTGDRLYVNVGSDGRGRSVTRLAVFSRDNRARSVRTVPGTWALPEAVPGQAEGISWDGSRAVAVSTTDSGRFVAVSTGDPTSRPRTIRPRGRLTYDGLAADGRTLFLTQHADAAGEPRYRVLRYDIARGVLDPRPVVDKAEGEPFLVGEPVARATNRDFLYTIYENRKHPFVHALKANGDYALCLDLPQHRQSPAIAAAWRARRVTAASAVIANAQLRTAYRLSGGELRPVPYGTVR